MCPPCPGGAGRSRGPPCFRRLPRRASDDGRTRVPPLARGSPPITAEPSHASAARCQPDARSPRRHTRSARAAGHGAACARHSHGAPERSARGGSRASGPPRGVRRVWSRARGVLSKPMHCHGERSETVVGASCPPGEPIPIRSDKRSRHPLAEPELGYYPGSCRR
jgi:hypothetical protein